MNRGARRAPTFRAAADCQLFLDWIADTVLRHGIEVHVFCLMPNHFHLLVRSIRGNLSKALKHLLAGYVLELNRRYRWDGPVFRGRFRSQLVEDDDYLRYLVAYLHLNPVRAQIVQRPEEALWSSAEVYLRSSRGPEWLVTEEVLSWFESRNALVQYHWDCAVNRLPPPRDFCPETGLFRNLSTVPAPEPLSRNDRSFDGSPVEEIMQLVAEAIDVPRRDLLANQRGRGRNRARRVLTWVLATELGMGCKEIAAIVGGTPNAVSLVLVKMRRRLRTEAAPDGLEEALEAVRKRTLDGS